MEKILQLCPFPEPYVAVYADENEPWVVAIPALALVETEDGYTVVRPVENEDSYFSTYEDRSLFGSRIVTMVPLREYVARKEDIEAWAKEEGIKREHARTKWWTEVAVARKKVEAALDAGSLLKVWTSSKELSVQIEIKSVGHVAAACEQMSAEKKLLRRGASEPAGILWKRPEPGEKR